MTILGKNKSYWQTSDVIDDNKLRRDGRQKCEWRDVGWKKLPDSPEVQVTNKITNKNAGRNCRTANTQKSKSRYEQIYLTMKEKEKVRKLFPQ